MLAYTVSVKHNPVQVVFNDQICSYNEWELMCTGGYRIISTRFATELTVVFIAGFVHGQSNNLQSDFSAQLYVSKSDVLSEL